MNVLCPIQRNHKTQACCSPYHMLLPQSALKGDDSENKITEVNRSTYS